MPQKISRETLKLIPKCETKFCGISILEIIWKLVSNIINTSSIDNIKFHDSLHGFRRYRGTGTVILEAKILVRITEKKRENFIPIHLRPIKGILWHLKRNNATNT